MTRRATKFILWLAIIAVPTWGCTDSGEAPRKQLVEELRRAKKLVLRYPSDEHHFRDLKLEIDDERRVSELVAMIRIKRVETASSGGYVGIACPAMADFCDASGEPIVTLGFYRPSVLHQVKVGQIYLSDNRFEEALTELASKKEGRPMTLDAWEIVGKQ
jgi:hypothetical protein